MEKEKRQVPRELQEKFDAIVEDKVEKLIEAGYNFNTRFGIKSHSIQMVAHGYYLAKDSRPKIEYKTLIQVLKEGKEAFDRVLSEEPEVYQEKYRTHFLFGWLQNQYTNLVEQIQRAEK